MLIGTINCLIGTHMCVHPVSEWLGFFLPLGVNCWQVALFQIMPALCPHGQGEGGGWSSKCGQAWTRGGGPQKFPNLCRHPLWMTPSPIGKKQLPKIPRLFIHNKKTQNIFFMKYDRHKSRKILYLSKLHLLWKLWSTLWVNSEPSAYWYSSKLKIKMSS